MPNLDSAKKAMRSSGRKAVFNVRRKRAMKEALKDVRKLVAGGDVKGAEAKMPVAQKAIDKAAKRGIIKKNNASRTKSRLAKMITRAKG